MICYDESADDERMTVPAAKSNFRSKNQVMYSIAGPMVLVLEKLTIDSPVKKFSVP